MSSIQPTVLITGVSSGIGAGLMGHWLGSGARVLGVSRREPVGLKALKNLRFTPLDLIDYDQIPATLDQLLDGVDRVHHVILNAGILGKIADLASTTIDDSKRVVEINLWANKALLDDLLRRDIAIDQVVTISSGAAVNGNRGWGAYSISKAALNMLTLLYSREFPEIHFSAIAPGLVDTAMQDYLCALPNDERYPSLEALKSKRHTVHMPSGTAVAKRLRETIERLPELVESGSFHDIRTLPGSNV